MHIYAYAYTYIFVPRRLRSSTALRRGGMLHKAGHPGVHSACVYHRVSARICTPLPHLPARHSRRAPGAPPPCPPGRLHWPRATPRSCSHSCPVKVRTRKRQCPAIPQMPLPPAADHLVPVVHTEYHHQVPRPPPPPLLVRTPHTMHAPSHAPCPTCRSRASASLVASISSFAAASCLLLHASHRAVWPHCTCVCVQMRHSTHARVWGAGGHQRWKEGKEREGERREYPAVR